uniref:C2H2-type domain-containing protein n=1 Tax=Rhabditophanes sp. KR3021 TaxID=114890 RepID=A0AC35TMI3_9BILA
MDSMETFRSHVKLIHLNGTRMVGCGESLNNEIEMKARQNLKQISTPSNSLKCSVCDLMCLTQNDLDEHRLTHCKIIKSNKCGICQQNIKSKSEFLTHSRTHNYDSAQLNCIICWQSVRFEKQLEMHAEFHLSEENNETKLDSFFSIIKEAEEIQNQVSLNDEKESKGCESPKEVEVASSVPSFLKKLNEDISLEPGLNDINEFKCPTCLKQFTSLCALQGHSHIHLRNSRNYKCDICSVSFATKPKLTSHTKRHLCRKEIKCQICDKKFVRPDYLKIHMKEHELKLMTK